MAVHAAAVAELEPAFEVFLLEHLLTGRRPAKVYHTAAPS